ncbi:DUF4388 domain-containing protein [Candidatus Uabimicrobium sp. HlEnr_7]|uniref:DUF4388 domain-containing protein n=1 Tax=Candidatus Uabimicrobium helgolandensis TaxID=3095367 RepID=UPI003558F9AE
MSELEILPVVLKQIHETSQTGTLMVENDEEEIFIYLKEGMIRSLAFAHGKSILAESLRNFDKINKETLRAIFFKQREMITSLLDALRNCESVPDEFKDENFLANICRNQIEEELYDALNWEGIKCEFMQNELSEEVFDLDLVNLPINIKFEALLMEAARRADEWEVIKEIIPTTKDIPAKVVAQSESKSEDDKRIFDKIDGKLNIDEILTLVRLSNFQGMKIMSDLIKTEKVRLKTVDEIAKMTRLDSIRNDGEKCISIYELLESKGYKDYETISWLARAYDKKGLTAKAAVKYNEQGQIAFDEDKYEEATKAYNKVVDFSPDNLEAYEKLIHCYYKSSLLEKAAEVSAVYARKISVKDKRKAIMVLDEANKNYPSSSSNLELMASLYIEMGDKENAISVYYILAMLMNKQKKPELALSAYRKILAINPNDFHAQIELGDGLIKLNKHNEAVDQYKNLGKSIFSEMKDAKGNERGSEDALIEVCKWIIKYEPESIIARDWLCEAYVHKKKIEEAIKSLKENIELLKKSDNKDSLVTRLRKLIKLDPDDFNNRKLLSSILFQMERRSESIAELIDLGTHFYDRSDLRKAREAFESLLSIDPFNLHARHCHANILRQLHRHARAVEEYRLVGYLAKSLGMHKEAIEAFSKVIELAPGTERAQYMEIAHLYECLGEYEEAVNYYFTYAKKSLTHGNYGEVRHICSRIQELKPQHDGAKSLKEQAETKLELMPRLI